MARGDLDASVTEDGDEAFAACVSARRAALEGYARSIVHDAHTAQDVVQETLIAALAGRASLREPRQLDAWLRGIVRFQCYRVLRRRHAVMVALDRALTVADPGPSAEEQVERLEQTGIVGEVIQALPSAYQDVVRLFYLGDLSQAEVAAQLSLPVTTVNNRLHAARTRLKGDLAMALNSNRNDGIVVRSDGTVFEARFAADVAPPPLTAIEFGTDGRGPAVVVGMSGSETVKGVAARIADAPRVNTSVSNLGTPAFVPLDSDAVVAVMERTGARRQTGTAPAPLKTGIKAVDLLCLMPVGGRVALVGDVGAGKLALLEEMVRRLPDAPLSLFDFVQAGHESTVIYGQQMPSGGGALLLTYLPIDDPRDVRSATSRAIAALADSVLYLSHDLARRGLYPAIDAAHSGSRLLESEAVTPEHRDLAERTRQLLTDGEQSERARRVQAFLTQPFFIAEPFTGIPGVRVSLRDTLDGVRAILDGECDGMPVEELMFRGSLSHV